MDSEGPASARHNGSSLVTVCVLAVLFAMLIVFLATRPDPKTAASEPFHSRPSEGRKESPLKLQQSNAGGYPYNFGLEAGRPFARSTSMRTAAAYGDRFYSTADIDPLVLGQYSQGREYLQDVHGGRTAHSERGLVEFSRSADSCTELREQPGLTGVDVGPLGLKGYNLDGKPDVFDDGIPENWYLPSTPVSWWKPTGPGDHDYYDYGEGAARPISDTHYMPFEPDHEPLLGPSP